MPYTVVCNCGFNVPCESLEEAMDVGSLHAGEEPDHFTGIVPSDYAEA